MSWVLFAVLAALIFAVVNTIDKFILTKWVRNPLINVSILGIVGLIASAVIFLTQGFASFSLFNIGLAIISGFLYFLGNALYFKAVQFEEISRIVPIFYLSPFFVLVIASVFLNEVLAPIKYFGIILLIAGAVLISSKSITKIRLGKPALIAILSAFVFAVELVVIKYLLSFADFWTVFSFERIGAFIAIIPMIYFCLPSFVSTLKEHGKKPFAAIALNESLNLTGVLFIIIATSIGFVTLVNALSSIQPLFVLLITITLSMFFPRILKEEIGKSTILQKFFAIILMLIGAALIT
ncbi:MAG: EamA family transporter [Candidatus ainarchaeum sp.]|nr:EamA family transporter [Candidatus ainarchaeum sp.]